MKSDFATSHIPIILLTALSSPEKQLEGIESGADAYISKPFSIKFLLARAFRLIEQREKLREKFSNEPGIIHAAMYSTDRDKEFTDRLDIILKANISRSDFSVEEFAQLMKLGRTVFYKKDTRYNRILTQRIFTYHAYEKKQRNYCYRKSTLR